jgi:hypothetical protein
VHAPAQAAVLALGVFTHADDIDVGRAASGKRRGDPGQQPDRAQVYVLSQSTPKRQKQLARGDVVGDLRIADRAEIDRVERPELDTVKGPA